ncbi:MAG: RING finger protein [Oscillospiraceae bacterium]|nr:RING finger protein [Oscillospiraceae bacterium]
MFIYQGSVCPYCGKPLTENDSLAVCPDCGTPHHRDCYAQHGRCANADKHADGFEWKPAVPVDVRRPVLCARCGRENEEAGRFCNYCGYEFGSDPREADAPDDGALTPGSLFYRNENGQPQPLSKDELIDDIPVGDWATYIGPSAPYYLYNFKMQQTTQRKTCFTLSAVLFPTLYFLYRKVWAFAAVSFGINTLLSLPAAGLLLLNAGLSLPVSAALLTSLARVCSFTLFAVNVFWGLFAVYLYRESAGRQIKALRAASAADADFQQSLQKHAGPCVLAVQLVFAGFMALLAIGYFFQ